MPISPAADSWQSCLHLGGALCRGDAYGTHHDLRQILLGRGMLRIRCICRVISCEA